MFILEKLKIGSWNRGGSWEMLDNSASIVRIPGQMKGQTRTECERNRSNMTGTITALQHLANCFIQVRKSIRTSTPRASLVPGTILILLAGRFRGKRVVLLKNLEQGVLLVTGPFKVNGVPIRRVNARYVIATSQKIDLAGVDSAKLEEISSAKYFAREKGDKPHEMNW